MMEWMEILILSLYFAVLGVLAAYGLHRLALALALSKRRPDAGATSEPDVWPRVTVQLPIFNEKYVAERLIDAVSALDYPRDRLEIQVLDDSTDETRDLVADIVERHRAQGVDIHHLHREDRCGYKAGALADGLKVATGEFVAVFDADFVPQSAFLKRSIPAFADPGVGMVQARWGHINRDYSLLTRAQSILLDAHFVVEHAVRERLGCLFNFNGTAGIWRRQAIEDAGGWTHDTLTEDLDLSYRAQLHGWRFHYLSEVIVPAELPAEINAYKSQQHRWAKGSVQTARKLLGTVMKTQLPLRAKVEAFIHLTSNFTYPLMLLLSLLIFPAMALRRGEESWRLLAFDLPLFLAATLSVVIFFLVSQVRGRDPGREHGLPVWRCLLVMPGLMAVGIGLSVNNTRAVLSGLREDGGVFHRTPKYKLEGQRDGWSGKAYALRKNLSFYLEALLALYFIGCFATAAHLGMWWSMPFLWLFLQGYVYMTWLGLDLPLRRQPAAA
ncbi:MAG: cellulose synthase family protein [Acidobacteriota bacterium]